MSVTGTPGPVLPLYHEDALTRRPSAPGPGSGTPSTALAREARGAGRRASSGRWPGRLERLARHQLPVAPRDGVNGRRSPGRVAIFGPFGALAAASVRVRRVKGGDRGTAGAVRHRAGERAQAAQPGGRAAPHGPARASAPSRAGATRTEPSAGSGDDTTEAARRPPAYSGPVGTPGRGNLSRQPRASPPRAGARPHRRPRTRPVAPRATRRHGTVSAVPGPRHRHLPQRRPGGHRAAVQHR